MPRLKVFRTTSGIHDHIVAASSRPAALKAWGARTDLFSMGVASEVTDPKLREQALEHPGKVIRISRSGGNEAPFVTRKTAKRVPKPSRLKLDAAERKLERLAAKQEAEMVALDRELQALQERHDALGQRHRKARSMAEEKVEALRANYDAALEQWSPGD